MAAVENNKIYQYLKNFSPSKTAGFSLWKATKNVQHQTLHSSAITKSNGDWAKSDTEIPDTFASHLDEVFSPFPRDPSISAIEEEHITNLVRYPETELEPITRVNGIQIQEIIKGLKFNKSPGYDLLILIYLKY